eukprot:jgi/Chrzof1/4352/Cz14g10010.t1
MQLVSIFCTLDLVLLLLGDSTNCLYHSVTSTHHHHHHHHQQQQQQHKSLTRIAHSNCWTMPEFRTTQAGSCWD